MENNELSLFENASPPVGAVEDDEEVVDLAGYQVTKAELFSHARDEAITIWVDRILSPTLSGGHAHSTVDTSRRKKAHYPPV